MPLVNTQYFRESAIYYEKHNKYPCGIKGSNEYRSWWEQERKRCLLGYSVGGMHITGYHYYYLNYCPIEIVKATKAGSKAGSRVTGFPKFWDVDYMFFQSMHIAKYGTTKEKLEKLPISLPIKTDPHNLAGGHHLIYLKPRGVGASYKNGSMASRNFHLVKGSNTFMLAHDKEYLVKDGIYSKFQNYRSFVNTYTEFRQDSDFKKGQNEMHYRASYDDGAGNELGSKAEVIGITVNGKPDKARGKRGILLLFEEAGRFDKMDQAWNVARNSVEEGGIVYGTMIAFGTGGTEGADFESMETMFDNPRAYNILAFDNIWDEGLEGMDCGFFTPAQMNVQHTDEDGNSNTLKGQKLIDDQIAEANLSPDPSLVLRRKAENPSCPREAMLNVEINKFATDELRLWRDKLFANARFREFGTPKTLYKDTNNNVQAKIALETDQNYHPPIMKYPHDKKEDIHGCVVEYTTPYWDIQNRCIPDNLYFICHDPYADDDAEDTTSLGAAYVMMNDNNIIPGETGDKIVASWIGRPRSTDEYNKILFMLAQRWNAKIAYESERGDVLGYAKRYNLTYLLADEFELAWDEKIKTKNVSSLRYGMRIGSGKNNVRKLTGNKYIEDWLHTVRTQTEDGKEKYNFHYIYDVGLLDELRKFKKDGNFDRISALRIGMFYKRELIYNDIAATKKKTEHKSFNKFIKHRRAS